MRLGPLASLGSGYWIRSIKNNFFLQAACPAMTELEMHMLQWFGEMIGIPVEFLPFTENGSGGGVIQVSGIPKLFSLPYYSFFIIFDIQLSHSLSEFCLRVQFRGAVGRPF
jgi:hypothetical protein